VPVRLLRSTRRRPAGRAGRHGPAADRSRRHRRARIGTAALTVLVVAAGLIARAATVRAAPLTSATVQVPLSLYFGQLSAGQTSETLTTYAENMPGTPNDRPVTVTAVGITGDQHGEFSVYPAETCTGATLAPGGGCLVSVRFQPSGAVPGSTTRQADLVLSLSDGTQATGMLNGGGEVFGSALNAQPPIMTLGPTPIGGHDGGTVSVGVLGDAAYSVESFQFAGRPSGDHPGDYASNGDNCTGTIVQGTGGCVIDVVQSPAGYGPRPALLEIFYCPYFSDARSNAGRPTTATPSSGRNGLPVQQCGSPGNIHNVPPVLVLLNGSGPPQPTTPPSSPTSSAPITPTTPVGTTPPTKPPATPSYRAAIVADPPLSPAGRVATIAGHGFPPNSTVTLTLSGAPESTTVTAAANGTFSTELVIFPDQQPGTYTVTAVTGVVTATTPFLVVPGSLVPRKFVERH
jgi:hypothetical protein